MKFYHGNATKPKMKTIRSITTELTHGVELSPGRLYDIKNDESWFFDNGAFTEDFNEQVWVESLEKIKRFDNEPDFVVLPDDFDNPHGTVRRAYRYVHEAEKRNLDYYFVAQKAMTAGRAVHEALSLDAEGIFVGGSWDWKHRTTEEIVELAHKNGLKVHIGMPTDYYWAYLTGADSMDSVSIVRNQNWDRLRNLEENIKNQTNIYESIRLKSDI